MSPREYDLFRMVLRERDPEVYDADLWFRVPVFREESGHAKKVRRIEEWKSRGLVRGRKGE